MTHRLPHLVKGYLLLNIELMRVQQGCDKRPKGSEGARGYPPTAEMESGRGQVSDGIIAVEGRKAAQTANWVEGHPS